jgi:hypothetical protein
MSNESPTQEQDHDIIVALGVDMLWLKTQISNHLAHHARYEVALLVAIVLMVIERFLR